MLEETATVENPFRPGAGHKPPYLAGRKEEEQEFRNLLKQTTILENMVLTGLRGVGKTVLLDTLKPIAISADWIWVGDDLSETTSISEENIAIRIMADLATVTSGMVSLSVDTPPKGFGKTGEKIEIKLNYETLVTIYQQTPGISSDKLKAVLETVWDCVKNEGKRGIIFAYDEAQNLADHQAKDQYPLSLLLDVFQSIQKKGVPFMLVLTGLPTLFPKLVEARTFAERMFRVVTLEKLNKKDSNDAIVKPTEKAECPFRFNEQTVEKIYKTSGGYPYFIQFVCREVFDVWIQKHTSGQEPSVNMNDILKKLDTNFFSGRWAKATDRQRELLKLIANLPNCESEFTVQEVVEKSKQSTEKSFSPSHVNQMLSSLCDAGLVYKNRYGKYSFAVPLFSGFIKRQSEKLGT